MEDKKFKKQSGSPNAKSVSGASTTQLANNEKDKDTADDFDLGPFSACDDVETLGAQINKIALALKTFCNENRNVHQPIKKLATELLESCSKLDPRLRKLRRSIGAMDKELSDVSMSIKLREYNDTMTQRESSMMGTSTPIRETFVAATQTDGPVPPPPLPQRESWSVVTKKKKRTKDVEVTGFKGPKDSAPPLRKAKVPAAHARAKQRKPRNDAILVEVEGSSSMEKKPAAMAAAEALKSKIDLDAHASIRPKLRVTRAGDLLIEAGRGQMVSEEFVAAVRSSIGDLGSARKLQNRTVVEILDVDPTVAAAEITRKLIEVSGDPDLKTGKVFAAYGGMSKVTASMSREAAARVTNQKFAIGWSICRTRIKTGRDRCYKCHGFGHIAVNCDGPDRSRLCMCCGEEGHIARSCNGKLGSARASRPAGSEKPGREDGVSGRESRPAG
jgi:hypothetical protein